MNLFKKIAAAFNASGSDRHTPKPDHIAQYGDTMHTRTFLTPQTFSLETALTHLQQDTLTHWEAHAHPEMTGMWSLRKIESCGDIRTESTASLVSFEEALNTLSLMEKHQESYHRHKAVNTHAALGDISFIRLAEKEGYTENTDGYMTKRAHDDGGGSYTLVAIERAKQTQAALQGGLADLLAPKKQASRSLSAALNALQTIGKLRTALEKNLYEAIYSYTYLNPCDAGKSHFRTYSSSFKKIVSHFDAAQNYIKRNPDHLLNAEDQTKLRTLFGALEVEICTHLAQEMLQQIKIFPEDRDYPKTLQRLNTHIERTWALHLTDITPEVKARIEESILQAPKYDSISKMDMRANLVSRISDTQNSLLAERVHTSLYSYMTKAMEQASTNPGCAQPEGLSRQLLPASCAHVLS